jgi:pyruvate formate lyase activating enzyme
MRYHICAVNPTPTTPASPSAAPNGVPVQYWRALADGRLQCDVCPRECKLQDGQRGLCFVRARAGDSLVLTTYGRSSGFCIDPIEKKPLNHFLPGSAVLSFGTAGCNLTCRFCQNHDISKSREMDTLMDAAAPEAIAEAAVRGGCRSIAFTYNDPVIFMEYAIDAAKAARARGLKAVAVTAGYMKPAARAAFYAHMDAANIDLKGFTAGFYQKLCSGELAPVLDTIAYACTQTPCWVELTTLLIPGENDDPEELKRLSDWVVSTVGAEVPIHFTAFHPDYRMTDTAPTPAETLFRAHDIARKAGIAHVYTGNIRDNRTAATHCTGCGARVIGRSGYDITAWALDAGGRCLACHTKLAGVFDGPPGTWGAKRQPVRMNLKRGD